MENQGSIVIANPLCKVEVCLLLLAIHSSQKGPENRIPIISFGLESDVLGAVCKALASPCKVTYRSGLDFING